MALDAKRKQELDALCNQFRIDVLTVLHSIQTGHPGGSLSVCEILTALYFEKANVDGKNPNQPDRDRIVLCKGHAAPMLYRVLAEKGYFPKEDLKTLRQIGSHLQGHPCSLHTPGVEVSTGPLGAGYPVALGMAMAQKLSGYKDAYTYAILGDGECNEGVIYETCQSAYKFKADNLITILDKNNVQLDGTADEIMPVYDMNARFAAFGYNVIEIDGHNIDAICGAIDAAKSLKGKPTIIIANTIKGKGVSFMEGKNTWHGKAIDDESFAKAMQELGGAK